jgi:anti-anti-sigma regulatory factor
MQDCDHLTLDLSEVCSIDARGLGALATIAKWALRKGVTFVASNPTRRVYDLICLVKLNTVIPVCASNPRIRTGYCARVGKRHLRPNSGS